MIVSNITVSNNKNKFGDFNLWDVSNYIDCPIERLCVNSNGMLFYGLDGNSDYDEKYKFLNIQELNICMMDRGEFRVVPQNINCKLIIDINDKYIPNPRIEFDNMNDVMNSVRYIKYDGNIAKYMEKFSTGEWFYVKNGEVDDLYIKCIDYNDENVFVYKVYVSKKTVIKKTYKIKNICQFVLERLPKNFKINIEL